MCQTIVKIKNREINYYKDIKYFIPYFYTKTITCKLPNKMSSEELLEWYDTNTDAKLWLDKEFEIAKKQHSVSQSNKALKIYTDPALEESKLKVFDALQRGRENGASYKGGMSNVESGHIKSLGEKWGGINWSNMAKEIFTCEVCGYTGSGRSNHKRWHGENCKLPLMEKMFKLLPNHFTRKGAMEILKKNNMKKSLIDKLTFKDLTYSEWTFKSYEGTKDHPYDIPIYSKKWNVNEFQKENLNEIIENNIKVGKEKIAMRFKKNHKTCKFCGKLQSPGNYVKNGHDTGKCMINKKY